MPQYKIRVLRKGTIKHEMYPVVSAKNKTQAKEIIRKWIDDEGCYLDGEYWSSEIGYRLYTYKVDKCELLSQDETAHGVIARRYYEDE